MKNYFIKILYLYFFKLFFCILGKFFESFLGVVTMYLFIPEVILQSSRLTGDEKIMLSYIFLLQKHSLPLFANYEYLSNNLGIVNPEDVLNKLFEKCYIRKGPNGWLLAEKSRKRLFSQSRF